MTAPFTGSELTALRKLIEAATAGPVGAETDRYSSDENIQADIVGPNASLLAHIDTGVRDDWAAAEKSQAFKDAQALAAAYNAAPRLIAAVEENARLKERIGQLLADNGCDCDCDHGFEEHDDDCERCLACLVDAALAGAGSAGR